MKKLGFKVLYGFLFAMVAVIFMQAVSLAAPAAPNTFQATQPGTSIDLTLSQSGNEWFSWVQTGDGQIVVKDSKQFWNYALLNNRELVSSGAKYGIDQPPANRQTAVTLKRWLNKNPSVMEAPLPAVVPSDEANIDSFGGVNAKGTQNILVLLVNTSNTTITTQDSYWQNIFFGDEDGTKSVKTFYKEASGEQLNFVPANETSGTANDGIVRVNAGMNHPNTRGNTSTPNQTLVRNALQAAHNQNLVDFSSFDTNGNGKISVDELHIVTVIAGYEASMTGAPDNAVWGHQWSLFNATELSLDGVRLGHFLDQGGYVQIGELHKAGQYDTQRPATLGIIVHELGHMFNLPDLYDTDRSSPGVGMHSLMAGGSWGTISYGEYQGTTPTSLDAWSKIQLGWITPTVVSSGKQNVTLKSIGTGDYNVVKIPSTREQEYFLLENRQFQGFDQALDLSLMSGGVAVWHIDETRTNNNTDSRRLVHLEKADRKSDSTSNNPYYYVGNATEFNSGTVPNSRLYGAKTGSGIFVTVNDPSEDEMSVTVVNAKADATPPVAPTGLNASDTTWTTTNLTWSASTDDIEVRQYRIFVNNRLVGTSSTTSYTVTGLLPNRTYSLTVRADDYAGRLSAPSLATPVTTPADTTAPEKPEGIETLRQFYTSLIVKWDAPEENVAVGKYEVYRNGTLVASVPGTVTRVTLTGLNQQTTYNITVKAIDTSNNASPLSDVVELETATDSAKPTAPADVRVTRVSATTLTLTWAAATDNAKLAGYNVYAGATKLNTSPITATTYNVSGLTAGASVKLYVAAVDAAGNESEGNRDMTLTTLSSATVGPAVAINGIVNSFARSGVTPTLVYTLGAGANVTIKVFNNAGQQVGGNLVDNQAFPKGKRTQLLSVALAGNYYVEVTATSNGNSTKVYHTFTLDTSAPTVGSVGAVGITHPLDVARISYTLSERARVTVQVIGFVNGVQVVYRTVTNNAVQDQGVQLISWDGRNNKKKPVANATYFVRITATDLAGNVIAAPEVFTVSVNRTS